MKTRLIVSLLFMALPGISLLACDDDPAQKSVCGNDLVETGEACDGSDFGGLTCATYGFTSGMLVCTAGCTIDTAACESEPEPFCGDGVIDTDEDCDGSDFNGLTCEALGFVSGSLSCSETCTIDTAACESGDPCQQTINGSAGCAFVAVPMANPQMDAAFNQHFGVLITNPNDVAVSVQITGGGANTNTPVAPNSSQVFLLPYHEDLRMAGDISGTGDYRSGFYLAAGNQGAYFIETDLPVTATQFNPFPDQVSSTPSYSSDGSVLIPIRDLTGEVFTMSRPTFMLSMAGTPVKMPGFLVIVATENNTALNIVSHSHITAGTGVPATAPGVPLNLNLNRGDIVQLLSGFAFTTCPTGPGATSAVVDSYTFCSAGDAYDLTGTRITANHPVAVWGGHTLAFVPFDSWAGDQLEEMMPPTSFLGTHHLVGLTHPVVAASTETNVIRVMAVENNTSVTFSPEVAPQALLNEGQFVEFVAPVDTHFEINASSPVQVGKYMVGANYWTQGSDNPGDPSFGLVVPTDRFRSSYTLAVPANHSRNFLQITSLIPTIPSEEIQVNGVSIPAAQYIPIGTSGYGVASIEYPKAVVPTLVQVHSQDPAITFGLELYGYSLYQSYLLPGTW